MVGAILLVSALIFGALAGGVVVQRLNSSPAASSEQDHSDETGDNGKAKTKTKHPNNGHHDPQEADESQDKDA
jgi:hypothetical protein